MARPNLTPRLVETEEALTVLFCLTYAHLNPRARCYESIKRLSDSEVIVLALFQQLRGERTLFLARRRKVLLPLVPLGGGASSFLVPSANEEAQTLFGGSAEGGPLRDDRRSGNIALRLYAA